MSKATRKDLMVRTFRLGEEPGDDLSASTTPEERVEMVAILTRRMVELGALRPVLYERADMPVRIIRPA